MLGQHFIRGWFKRWAAIALNSAEPELRRDLSVTCAALGAVATAKDLGHRVGATMPVGPSAAPGIAGTSVAGNIGVLDTDMM